MNERRGSILHVACIIPAAGRRAEETRGLGSKVWEELPPEAASTGAQNVAEITLVVNGIRRKVSAAEDTPLLWVLRDSLNLTGTKYGCGIAQCGACTVHLDGTAMKSCVTPVSVCAGKKIVTIEGLSTHRNHPVQKAWIAEDVPQCGYCQPGMIMTAAALLSQKKNPTDSEIEEALSHNICRCGTYLRIKRAIVRAAKEAGR